MIPTSPNAEMGEFISINNMDAEWINLYISRELHKNDPIAIHCMTQKSPMLWSTIFKLNSDGLLPSAQANVVNLALSYGLHSGVTIPLQKVGAFIGGMSLVSAPEISAETHDAQFVHSEAIIVEFCDVFHALIDRRFLSEQLYRLTPREFVMLELLSQGYQEKNIAFETGRSLHTIQKQIRSAKRKMKAVTPAQAVAKAVALRVLR